MGEKTSPRLTAPLWKLAALDSNASLVTHLLCELGCHLPSLMLAYPCDRVGARLGGPAHLLLHQVQRQGRAVGEGGGRWDLLLTALSAQALEVEGGSSVGCWGGR